MIPELFKEQVSARPNDTAICTGFRKISYATLDAISDNICSFLLGRYPETGGVVAVIGNRCWEFVAAMLGICKAGLIYLPIEDSTPVNRRNFMLKEADCKTVIALYTGADSGAGDTGAADFILFRDIPTMDASAQITYRQHHSAYIMYTSGSTGLPKGVIIPRKGIVRLVKEPNFIRLGNWTRILLTGAISFDASTFEIFGCILNGGTLYIEDVKILFDTPAFKNFIDQHGINTLWLTSPVFNQLIDKDPYLFRGSGIKYLLVGGDMLSAPHINKVLETNTYIRIINGYGPTENTTFSVTYEITHPVQGAIVPIGRAISRSEAYVLNEKMEPAGIFEIGEIYVGGDGLMEGYLKDDQLTESKLVDHPFSRGSKLYRTGDMGYWDSDQLIYCTGRNDSQLKINGYRIELNEIRHQVLLSGYAVDAVVHFFKDRRLLSAWLIPAAGYDERLLVQYLEASLPEYMVPHVFATMDTFPLNSNGKIDIRKLPEPGAHAALPVKGGNGENVEHAETRLFQVYERLLKTSVNASNLDDNFFDLGGNSIRLFRLLHEVERTYGVKIEARDFFQQLTMRYILLRVQTGEGGGVARTPIASKKEAYRLSAGQQRLYFLQELNRTSTSYNITSVYEIRGVISHQQVKDIFLQLLSVHETLRSRLVIRGAEVVQIVDDQFDIMIEEYTVPEQGIDQAVGAFVRPFRLDETPFRIGLIDIKEDVMLMMVDVHHCMFDGLSLKIMIEDFYKLLQGQPIRRREVTYKDFAEWQGSPAFDVVRQRQKQFWLSVFGDGELPKLEIVPDKPRPRIFNAAGQTVDFELSETLSSGLASLAADAGVTHFMLLYTLFNIVLYKVTGNEDIIVGVPVSGRSHFDLEDVVGLFANTLAFRVPLDRQKSFIRQLAETRAFCQAAFGNQDYPLEELISELKIERDISSNPLFQVMFTYNDFDISDAPALENAAVQIAPYRFKRTSTNFDLCLIAAESRGKFRFSLQYYKEIFEQDTIRTIRDIFIAVAEAVTSNGEIAVKDISMGMDMPPSDMAHEVQPGRPAAERGHDEDTIAHLFKRQAAASPDAAALICEDLTITYQGLYERAMCFSQALIRNGVQPGSVVAIRTGRGPDMVSSMLGVMLAGCCYLPMDPELPAARALSIFHNAGVSCIILSEEDELGAQREDVLFFGHVDRQRISGMLSHEALPFMPSAGDLAYIIYTSGSTGQPKGVAIRHRTIVNTLKWRINYYQFDSRDVTLQIPAYYFDSSVEDIFTTLLSGATLVLTKDTSFFRDLGSFIHLCRQWKVTNLLMVPSFYSELLHRLKDEAGLHFRFITLAGEHVNEQVIRRHFELLPGVALYNEYGPTECSVCTTAHQFARDDQWVSIGKPITGAQCLVMNKDGNICPTGIPGELYIMGAGLAAGYHNDPELTEKAFISSGPDNARMYKTGDLVRWRNNGDLEFLGRIDDQVKIRGFRIEIREVEHFLSGYEGVLEAVVIRDGDALSAYYTAQEAITARELRKYMMAQLPQYMVPSRMVQVAEFPRTRTGKIDRRMLLQVNARMDDPAPAAQEVSLSDREIRLLHMWREILRSPSAGAGDNFFESGGNSINILAFQNTIRNEMGTLIPVEKFFQYSNISSLSAFMEGQPSSTTMVTSDDADLSAVMDLLDQN